MHTSAAMRVLPLVRTTTTTASAPAVLRVGDALRERRRFTEDELAAYAAASGDRNPVHFDDALAREVAGFERGRVVHGMLVASLFPSLIASHFPGAVYARQSLKFALPVYIGDEVLAQVQVLHIKQSNARYIVKFNTKCFTSEDSLAVDGQAITVLPTLELNK